ncbi:MAG: RtcB family protein [Planctomycetes bacterium]|nr:RtcB family protein [Planctomycetota bacterium]
MSDYKMITERGAVPIKAWIEGVHFDENARQQLINTAKLPFVFKWVAAMPDVHWGLGATVGSVVATQGAIVPAAVGVDIGCGMAACRTTLVASDLPDNLAGIRSALERAVPHGRTNNGGAGDRGAWSNVPGHYLAAWKRLEAGYGRLVQQYPGLARNADPTNQLGTLGTGNHFIEICLDEEQRVWFMLHSGSRGVGNRIGTHFIELAKRDLRRNNRNLPDENLAYFEEGAEHFQPYVEAVEWAQNYAALNRELMMGAVVAAMTQNMAKPFAADALCVNCHHNYVQRETHYGQDVLVTRKGAVRAGSGDLGIIPGSMGARSFIVRGKGNPESFCSCSHGAGRRMSRTQAKKHFSLADHKAATEGVECRKDKDVIDETPGAYKDIDAVMEAQKELVEIMHTLKQVVCVKG